MKKILLLVLLTNLLFLPAIASDKKNPITSYEKAKILKIKNETIKTDKNSDEPTSGNIIFTDIQKIKIEILSGKHKNEIKIIENSLSNNPMDIKIAEGDKILVYLEEYGQNEYSVQIQGFYVFNKLIFFIALFFCFLIIIGGKQGLKAIVSLIISVWIILKIFIPQALTGFNPISLALITAIAITFISLTLISGFKKKTFSAISGTISGLIIAAIFAIIAGKLTHLNGLSNENARTLFSQFPNLNFSGLLFAGIIIGALGAVMDVAMSISSSISEVKKAHPEIGKYKLIKSGMTVGKDIMGTMSNTLIFAYTGSSIFLLLLFSQYGESYMKFLNFNFVAEEIIRSIAGSIGLILTVPLTAIIAGYLENKTK
ncbi:MAG: YibE/F family protein [Patescibacteria group bacterium]|nr:YibE/F family protein [Patescibacteria group bacterium]